MQKHFHVKEIELKMRQTLWFSKQYFDISKSKNILIYREQKYGETCVIMEFEQK